MQGSKLKVLLVALSLGAVTAAGAQTYVPATGDVADTAGGAPASMPQPLPTSPSLAPAPADTSADVPAIISTTDDATVILLFPNVAPIGIDSRADSKCRNVAVNDYWDCVNSSNGGQ